MATHVKALLLRVGIDKGTDGALDPIFKDGSFEYVPISEGDSGSTENRTYGTTIGRCGLPLSAYLPKVIEKRKMHFDPEFGAFTYGDPTAKRKWLLKLEAGDLLVFYAGLSPFQNKDYKTRLYIIGYFTVENVIDFNRLSQEEIEKCRELYPENAHSKRSCSTDDLVMIVGRKSESRLLNKAILISQLRPDKSGKPCQAISSEMETLLGISGFIQRSIPPRVIRGNNGIENLKRLLSESYLREETRLPD